MGVSILIVDKKTGVVLKEAHDVYGGLRAGRSVDRDRTGAVFRERFYLDSVLHRENAPAYIERIPKGSTILEMFYRAGQLHRDPTEGPAVLKRSETNPSIIVEEAYYRKHRPYRDPEVGPWMIKRNAETGAVEEQLYLTPEQFVKKNHRG